MLASTHPMPTGRRFDRVELVAETGSCSEAVCWRVPNAKFDLIYAALIGHAGTAPVAYRPTDGSLMMHMNERYLSMRWSGGRCAVEDSYQLRIIDKDRAAFDASWDAIGVLFGASGPLGMKN
ncbi:MAG: hypothetical protein IPL79_06090 [Myxococcales bacterium]|nr:hypothetical protein [Myxococcales bacterium]